MTLFHTTERLGKVQSVSREGFLICEGVPVSRTGDLLYAPGELPIAPGPDGLIHVHRSEDAVFHPDAISSFEGKSIVDLHPGVDVTPANWRRFAVGHMQNVRRGTGDQSHVLLADLVIKDAAAIREVRAGKRSVSLGYDASYSVTKPGFADQTNIIGNHVALVPQGRCGPTCSIGDEAMSTTTTGSRTWMDRIRSAFQAQDETMLAAALAEAPVGGGGSGGPVINVHAASTGDKAAPDIKEFVKVTADAMTALNAAVKDIGAKVAALDAKVVGIVTKDGEREDAAVKVAEIALAEARAAKEKADAAEEDKEKTKTADAATKDSVALASVFQDCVSRAETLVPGVAIPTFDAKARFADTEAALCGFRRKVLTAAQAAVPSRAHVNAVLPAGSDLATMTCDSVGFVFQGATELAKAANNRGAGAGRAGLLSGTEQHKGPMTPAQINEMNRKFYSPNSR